MDERFNEDFLLKNPDLCSDSYFMHEAVSYDPKLIRFAHEKCYFEPEFLCGVFKSYRLTVDDLYFNPHLCGNPFIMKFYPEFRLYYSYLSFDEKVDALVSCLKSFSNIFDLPFFDIRFNPNLDVDSLKKLHDILKLNVDSSDIDSQGKYYYILDHLIDGIVKIRYENCKSSFKYNGVVSLNNAFISAFDSAFKNNNYDFIASIIDDIYCFLDKSLPFNYITEKVNEFYNYFVCNGCVDLSFTDDFCNYVLNMHRNNFISSLKKEIVGKLYYKFNLSEKKKTSVLNRTRLSIVSSNISSSNYSTLGITEDEFDILLNKIVSSIARDKHVLKYGFNSSMSESLISYFKCNGFMDEFGVINSLGLVDSDVIKFVCQKFERVKLKFVDNVILSDDQAKITSYIKSSIGFNYNNFLIFDEDRYFRNFARILLFNYDYSKIFNNKHLDEVVCLLPFVDVFDDFSISDFMNILYSYDSFRDKVIFSGLFNNIDSLISLSKVYSSIDCLELLALGPDFSSLTDDYHSYIEFYFKMIERKDGHIPPVSFSMDGFDYCSGVFSDVDRLLIGHNVKANSCITLGTDTYNKLLLDPSGDVVLVRKDGKLVSRILLFRRGNVIQIVSNACTKFPINVYKEICNQIVSKSVDDNIDFVFVNCSSYTGRNDGDIVTDNRFITSFPHADFYNSCLKLYGDNVDSMDFDVPEKGVYSRVRSGVIEGPKDYMISRLRALDVLMEKDTVVSKSKRLGFEPFFSDDYKYVACGEDWYITVSNDGDIQEVVLPSCDCYEEVELYRNKVNSFKNVK